MYAPGGMNAGMVLLYLIEMGPEPGVGHPVVSQSLTVSCAISAPAYLMSTEMEPSGMACPDATEAATSKAASWPATTGSGMSFTSWMVMDSLPSPHDFQVALPSTSDAEGAEAARNTNTAAMNVVVGIVTVFVVARHTSCQTLLSVSFFSQKRVACIMLISLSLGLALRACFCHRYGARARVCVCA